MYLSFDSASSDRRYTGAVALQPVPCFSPTGIINTCCNGRYVPHVSPHLHPICYPMFLASISPMALLPIGFRFMGFRLSLSSPHRISLFFIIVTYLGRQQHFLECRSRPENF
ncbi:hypothetical protein BS17DRAFT_787072 [Gyrodon lividus]|nr:hypothetical protein BS17DRAFT_787072 [Gyrodon lividus]